MTRDPAQMSGPDRDRRTPEADRRELIRQDGPANPPAHGSSLEHRCRQVTEALRDALGPDGCSALLGRALDSCESRHPVLKDMRGPDGREIRLEGVAEGIERYGVDAAEAGIDAMFASLADILGRLIGEDMAMQLIGMDVGEAGSDEETS